MENDLLDLLDLTGAVCAGIKVGEGLEPELLLLVSEVILGAILLCCCGGEEILVADAAVSGGPRATEEAGGVFGIGALGKSSPNRITSSTVIQHYQLHYTSLSCFWSFSIPSLCWLREWWRGW